MAKAENVNKNKKATPPQGSKLLKRLVIAVWSIVLFPFIGIGIMLLIASSDLPNVEELENPRMNLASEIYTADNVLLGKYFKENRTNVQFNELSTYLVDCLVATEDERFYDHTGIDFEALGRVVKGVLTGSSSSGGGSTITQQLAKNLFKRKYSSGFGLVSQKFKEWIIAARIEKRYTKEEIITMYFNQFDFLNNAVGIKSAARVYFNTTPDSLTLDQSAILVGMAKNPSLFNPVKYPENATKRREVVLKQLLKNIDNPNFKTKFSEADYNRVRKLPLGIEFTKVDHVEGLAPYFREELRKDLGQLFAQKNANGEYKIRKKDGQPFNVYEDGLKIYTTLDSRMQKYGEWAVREYLSTELQKKFDKDNKRWKRAPFASNATDEKIEELMKKAIKQSTRYKMYTGQICAYCERGKDFVSKRLEGNKPIFYCSYCKHRHEGKSEAGIDKMFNTKIKMKVFSWLKPSQEFDTVMSPVDSIKYYMKFIQAALISIDPHTGFIKAWVGGADYRHFKYDHVNARRQVGSTFKPFVYAAAFRDRLFTPCSEIPDVEHCIEVQHTAKTTKPWCPSNGEAYTGQPMPLYFALPQSMNNITAAVIKVEKAGTVIKMLEAMGIEKGYLPPVPSICLGSCELSPYEMTGAQATFANKGIYIKPIMFTRIEDKNGNVIYDVEPETSEAMDEETAYTMCMVMKGATTGVVHPSAKNSKGNSRVGGTATGIRRSDRKWGGLKYPVAGKTGTTQNNTDGWFMGITPDLVTGVWTGADNSAVHWTFTNDGQGATTALPIWGYYMNKVYADKSIKISIGDFEAPEGFNLFDCKDFASENSDLWKQIDLKENEEMEIMPTIDDDDEDPFEDPK
jgi:penicillin-binding protein 1A